MIYKQTEKAASLALIVILQKNKQKLSTAKLSKVTGRSLRSVQRDIHDAEIVDKLVSEIIEDYKYEILDYYTIKDVSKIFGIITFRTY